MITFKQFLLEFASSSMINSLENKIRKECKLAKFWLSHKEGSDIIGLQIIVVNKEAQGEGRGTKAMQMLCAFADKNGMKIALSPSAKSASTGTTSKTRLIHFYERFGFVKNSGKTKDHSISAEMVRTPS